MTGTPDPTTPADTTAHPDTMCPPDPADAMTVICPCCSGAGIHVTARTCGPTTERTCVTCRQAGTIDVYWASSDIEPAEERRTHLVQVVTDPLAPCVCDHAAIPAELLAGGFLALPCQDCLRQLNHMDKVERRLAQLTVKQKGAEDGRARRENVRVRTALDTIHSDRGPTAAGPM